LVQELLGRDAERRSLAGLLDAVVDGTHTAATPTLVVQGDPGAGKSALLDWLGGAASERGFTVLRTTGLEFERELAFGGLLAVLWPVLDLLDALAPAQQHALRVATGLDAEAHREVSALQVHGATLSLLSAAAEEQPVLVVVDDAHWLDRASLETLLFAASRRGVDPVGFVFAQRTSTASLLDGFDHIELSGLDRDVARELLGAGVDEGVAERCWSMTGGNPLAMIEGVRGLSDRQRVGDEPLPPALPAAGRLLSTFDQRLDGLPEAAARAMGLAALASHDDLSIVAVALTALSSDCSVNDLEDCEAEGLMALSGNRIAWSHPLLRSAAYQRLGGAERRAAHRALATAEQRAGHAESALWHLSEASVGPDDGIATQLAALGRAARQRGALTAAAQAHERAAALSTSADERDRQLVAAADACWASGDLAGTAELLADQVGPATPARTRSQLAIVLGQVEMWTSGTAAGITVYEQHAAAGAGEADIATSLLLHATTAQLLALDTAAAVRTASRSQTSALGSGDTTLQAAASAVSTLVRLFDGQAEGGADLSPLSQLILAVLDSGGDRPASTEGVHDLAHLCAWGLLCGERWTEAADLLRRVSRSSEASGMTAASAFARVLLAEVLWRTGRWAEALAEVSQSLDLQQAVRPGQVIPGTLAVMARLEAALGRADDCRAHVAQVLDQSPRIELFDAVALSALGLLELGLGHAAEAAAALDRVAVLTDRAGEPGWLWWQGDAIEAHLAAGRPDDARRVLDRLAAQSSTGRWSHAAAERAHALLDEDEPRLSAAVDLFRALGTPFEEARTLLQRGRPRDIAAARTIFDRLGARPWSDRASALAGQATTADQSLTSRLTPAELRVALAVARGASNREAADQLFVSLKTVEYHLQNIYRKLHLRSRTQLASLVFSNER
jgi:DNA-binding CsgD family transcriptional regulator